VREPEVHTATGSTAWCFWSAGTSMYAASWPSAALPRPQARRRPLATRQRTDPLHALTPREREVLELMAQGQSNAGIAKTLRITHGAIEKQIKHIFAKLGIPATSDTHRRVLAAITFLETR
jgi:DNA-binding NarL/FixJ family response regulator